MNDELKAQIVTIEELKAKLEKANDPTFSTYEEDKEDVDPTRKG